MSWIVKVFDISSQVKENPIDDTQRLNVLKIFDTLSSEPHLITKCYLDRDHESHKNSPIFYLNEAKDKNSFDYEKIANDLLKAECKADNTRNNTIREGLLFIRAKEHSINIIKLEKLGVIDMDSYEFKHELGKEKDYFKACVFKGDYNDIKIIDKNRTAAKYWFQSFLRLSIIRGAEENTSDVINLLANDKFYLPSIVNRENYKEIKRFTEFYLFDNKRFDKTELLNKLNSEELIVLKEEDDLYSMDSESIDSDFEICKNTLNKKYRRKIQVSKKIKIVTQNYLESIRDNLLNFDEKNKKITLVIDDEYLDKVKESLKDV